MQTLRFLALFEVVFTVCFLLVFTVCFLLFGTEPLLVLLPAVFIAAVGLSLSSIRFAFHPGFFLSCAALLMVAGVGLRSVPGNLFSDTSSIAFFVVVGFVTIGSVISTTQTIETKIPVMPLTAICILWIVLWAVLAHYGCLMLKNFNPDAIGMTVIFSIGVVFLPFWLLVCEQYYESISKY